MGGLKIGTLGAPRGGWEGQSRSEKLISNPTQNFRKTKKGFWISEGSVPLQEYRKSSSPDPWPLLSRCFLCLSPTYRPCGHQTDTLWCRTPIFSIYIRYLQFLVGFASGKLASITRNKKGRAMADPALNISSEKRRQFILLQVI
jgi:hypothetical protein